MQNFDKYLVSIYAIVLYGLTFFLLHWLKVDDIKIYLSCFVAISTIYFGSLKLKLSDDELFYKLFSDFNNRYDKKLNDLLNELRISSNDQRKLDLGEKKLVIDYFNLCAEEYLWFKKGRLQREIWNAWKAGIIENLKIIQVFEIYQDEMKTDNGCKAYYGLEDEMKKLIKKRGVSIT